MLIELMIVPIIPHTIARFVLAGIGSIAAIVGLVFAANKVGAQYVNRSRIITIFVGMLIWFLALISTGVMAVLKAKNTVGIILLFGASFILSVSGQLMILIPAYRMDISSTAAVPSFGQVSKSLVLIPVTILCFVDLVLNITIPICIFTNSGMAAMGIIAYIRFVLTILGAICATAGLVVGIVKYRRESRQLVESIPKYICE